MPLNIPALVRMGVKLAEKHAGSVRVNVLHLALIGQERYGPVYADAVVRLAMVEDLSQTVVGSDGSEQVSMSKLTFLEPINVKDGDVFVLPDNTRGRVIKRGGLIDGSTAEPYLTEVWLGK